MTERPLAKLVRLVGGVALLPGPIGHQALGQLLIAGSKVVEVAGANVAVTAAFRQSSSAVQLAVGTVVPAAVVEVLSSKEERRLIAERQRIEALSRRIAGQPKGSSFFASLSLLPDVVVDALVRRLEQEQRRAEERDLQQQDKEARIDQQVDELRSGNERLAQEIEKLRLDQYAKSSSRRKKPAPS